MNKLFPAIAAIGLVLPGAAALAQDTSADAARQQRMDAAYAAHHDASSTREEDRARHDAHAPAGSGSSGSLREDTRQAGHAIHNGVKATGHAVHTGVRATGHAVHTGVKATGHAIHQGVKATGHAIHEGVDKLTGK